MEAKPNSVCFQCDFDSQQVRATCPECGAPLLTGRAVRRRGWILTGTGVSLALGIAVVAFYTVRVMLDAENPEATTRFEGTTWEAAFILGVYYLVFMFGSICLVAGVWQLRYGRRNRRLMHLVLMIAFLLFFIGITVSYLL
jgi:MFS family permease